MTSWPEEMERETQGAHKTERERKTMKNIPCKFCWLVLDLPPSGKGAFGVRVAVCFILITWNKNREPELRCQEETQQSQPPQGLNQSGPTYKRGCNKAMRITRDSLF